MKVGFKGSRIQRFRRLLVWAVLLVCLPGTGSRAGEPPGLFRERQKVEQAARLYLDAEMRRDYPAVFSCLYPASDYRKANDFEAYRAEAKSSAVRIISYEILDIVILPDNPDKELLPAVDGFARVEVDVRIHYADSGQQSLVNYAFPFVRAGGKWYKL